MYMCFIQYHHVDHDGDAFVFVTQLLLVRLYAFSHDVSDLDVAIITDVYIKRWMRWGFDEGAYTLGGCALSRKAISPAVASRLKLRTCIAARPRVFTIV